MTEPQFNIAIVGCGQFGHKRAAATLACDELQLIGVYDQDALQAQNIAASTQSHIYPTFEAVLADHKVAGVIICTPNYLHARQSVAALRAGKHVLCEKPAGISNSDLKSLATAINSSQKMNWQYGQNHRFFESTSQVKKWLSQQKIGELTNIELKINSGRNKSTQTWFANEKKSGGGTLIDNGYHLLDLLSWYLPEQDWQLREVILNRQAKSAVESTAVVMLDAGSIAVKIACYWETADNYLTIQITGKNGTITATDHSSVLHSNKHQSNQEYTCIPGSAIQSELKTWVANCRHQPQTHALQYLATAQKTARLIQSVYDANGVIYDSRKQQ